MKTDAQHIIEAIDLKVYKRSGAGINGESFDSLEDPAIMVKLYKESYSRPLIVEEMETARKVYSLGIPSPEPVGLVECGNRLGIKFRKITGKRSFSRALADEPERVGEFAREFARYAKKLHSTVCPKGMFPSQKEQYLKLLDADREFSDSEHDTLRKMIMEMPDSDTAVHGDLHIGNLLTTLPKGAPLTDPHKVMFIDLGYFATGTPLLDIGMLIQVCLFSDEEFRMHEMHVPGSITKKFWDEFVREYFFGAEGLGMKLLGCSGPASRENLLRIEEAMIPYAAIKCLIIGFNSGMPTNCKIIVRKAIEMSKAPEHQ